MRISYYVDKFLLNTSPRFLLTLLSLFLGICLYVLYQDYISDVIIASHMQEPDSQDVWAYKSFHSAVVIDDSDARGSGFVVDSLVITAAHVVDENYVLGKPVDVYFQPYDNPIQASIVECVPQFDLAILKPDSIPHSLKKKIFTLQDLQNKNEKPQKNDRFIGYGFPQSYFSKFNGAIPDQKSIDTCDSMYFLYRSERELSAKQSLKGASGSLMFSEQSWCMPVYYDTDKEIIGTIASQPIVAFLNLYQYRYHRYSYGISVPGITFDDFVEPGRDDDE